MFGYQPPSSLNLFRSLMCNLPIVTIENEKYSGNVEINKKVPGNFTVGFKSNGIVTKSGFILNWRCKLVSDIF